MQKKPFGLSVKIFIRDERGCFLFLKRSLESSWNPGKWDLPGGKVDEKERFDLALCREVKEETGLPVVLEGVLGAGEYETATHRVAQLILWGTSPESEVQLSGEHMDYAWVDPRDLESLDLCGEIRSILKKLSLP